MRSLLLLLAALAIFEFPASGQENPTGALAITAEPHHRLLVANEETRAFSVTLLPGEATLPHRHSHSYAYLSLNPAEIGNEVKGHPPVVTEMKPGELRTSKGGFDVAERNDSPDPAHLYFIEAMKSGGAGFSSPMGGFRLHDAAYGELFESPAMRGYILNIASGGRIEERPENYDRLIVALTDLDLRETTHGQTGNFEMKAGEVRWIPRGTVHSTSNAATFPAALITFEFD